MIKFILAVMVIMIVTGCDNKQDLYPHKYNNSQIVYSKLDGRRGMVVTKHAVYIPERYGILYDVRFSALEATTDSRVLSSDGAIKISPYSTVTMQEYELTTNRPVEEVNE